MVNGCAAEVLKQRRQEEAQRKRAAALGIDLRDLRLPRNKKYVFYTPARDKDVFNRPPPWEQQRSGGEGGGPALFRLRTYHRRNDVQQTVAEVKNAALFDPGSSSVIGIMSGGVGERLAEAGEQGKRTVADSPSSSTLKRPRAERSRRTRRKTSVASSSEASNSNNSTSSPSAKSSKKSTAEGIPLALPIADGRNGVQSSSNLLSASANNGSSDLSSSRERVDSLTSRGTTVSSSDQTGGSSSPALSPGRESTSCTSTCTSGYGSIRTSSSSSKSAARFFRRIPSTVRQASSEDDDEDGGGTNVLVHRAMVHRADGCCVKSGEERRSLLLNRTKSLRLPPDRGAENSRSRMRSLSDLPLSSAVEEEASKLLPKSPECSEKDVGERTFLMSDGGERQLPRSGTKFLIGGGGEPPKSPGHIHLSKALFGFLQGLRSLMIGHDQGHHGAMGRQDHAKITGNSPFIGSCSEGDFASINTLDEVDEDFRSLE